MEYRRQQAEALSQIRSQVEPILRSAFISVDNILNKVTESLKWNIFVYDSDAADSHQDVPAIRKRKKPQPVVNVK